MDDYGLDQSVSVKNWIWPKGDFRHKQHKPANVVINSKKRVYKKDRTFEKLRMHMRALVAAKKKKTKDSKKLAERIQDRIDRHIGFMNKSEKGKYLNRGPTGINKYIAMYRDAEKWHEKTKPSPKRTPWMYDY